MAAAESTLGLVLASLSIYPKACLSLTKVHARQAGKVVGCSCLTWPLLSPWQRSLPVLCVPWFLRHPICAVQGLEARWSGQGSLREGTLVDEGIPSWQGWVHSGKGRLGPGRT